jgi:alkylhydroperoxidase family enzyme
MMYVSKYVSFRELFLSERSEGMKVLRRPKQTVVLLLTNCNMARAMALLEATMEDANTCGPHYDGTVLV